MAKTIKKKEKVPHTHIWNVHVKEENVGLGIFIRGKENLTL